MIGWVAVMDVLGVLLVAVFWGAIAVTLGAALALAIAIGALMGMALHTLLWRRMLRGAGPWAK